ncbi:MAG: GntR family transcriptional regulator, partial [Planctomycetaceae bacterium]|nr:GntR family transcriptional regulator [Planctomycetaceae bacterium]
MDNNLPSEPSTAGGLLEPVEIKAVVDRIVDRLTQAILSRELLPGQKIPTETDLCESLRVGRNSVREAIKVLVAMGVLVIRRSEGTFVSEGFSERMLDPMVYGLFLEGGDSFAIIELRKLFDTGVLQLAITKRTEAEVVELEAALAAMASILRENPTEEALLKEDLKFHRIIGLMARNPLADKISMVIERLTLPSRTDAVRSFIDKGEFDGFLRKHQDLVRVIKEQDDAAVGRTIDDHYSHWRSVSVRMRPRP